MLELENIHFTITADGEDRHLLEKVSIKVPRGHFMAIVGPSGCGKSTLLKTIAGINLESAGDLKWDGRNLSEEGDLEPWEFGYVPQFSIAYEELTVEESIDNAIRLKVKTRNRAEMEKIADRIIDQVGLDGIRQNRVSVLSGGQKRRLGLALEMATDPDLLLCDEVTSGLDPKSENEIVRLLHNLAKSEDRIVVSVTHSLGNLDLYDSVLVLYEGKVVYHGPPRALNHYFGVDEAEDVYPALAKRESEAWRLSWEKHAPAYYESMPRINEGPKIRTEEEIAERKRQGRGPGFFSQLAILSERRWKIFFRDKVQLFLQLAMLLIFPAIVVLFAYDGIPDLKRPSDTRSTDLEAEIREERAVTENRMEVGGIISGLVMFQVVLLALMGSNNAAREIAGEREIFEKEKLGGLKTASYLGSKCMYLSVLVLVQSLWMYLFVSIFTRIPSHPFFHAGLLVLVNAAMTAICLGISASMKSADQASLLSIYLVGFQLPLSGAVLALPKILEPVITPFISAYWSWSGVIQSLEGRFFTAADTVTDATLRAIPVCGFVLLAHFVLGMTIALIGASRARWSH